MKQRQHDLDAVRAIFMLMGIPLHTVGNVSTLYSSDEFPFVFNLIPGSIQLFRMQGFFLIAGYFSAMLLSRMSARAFLLKRSQRLLPPLATGLLLVIPLRRLVDVLRQGEAEPLFPAWWSAIAEPRLYATGHLWFLLDLIYFTVAAAAACLLLGRPSKKASALKNAGSWKMGLIFFGIFLAVFLWEMLVAELDQALPELRSSRLAVSFALHYAPFFAMGIGLWCVPVLDERYREWSWFSFVIGGTMMFLSLKLPAFLPSQLIPVVRCLTTFFVIQVFLGAAYRWFSVDRRWVRYLVDASFTVYIIHLLIVQLLVWLLQSTSLNPWAMFSVVLFGTLLLSFAFWEICARSATLRYWWGGPPLAPEHRQKQRHQPGDPRNSETELQLER
ncbi:acyltransferase family protein [Stakelama tenebrarum]|uniref:Acyltransferase family protein n=1 Tax=Stakelama tenebrarum TaxID=2711215 RepID=A0A6G6Y6T4_9SPHN|nr:acyltransferase family protein [Sphingosinithalassobacter tenebrarum]QIG80619.1 acyltransferase family protein [Sphingosinithalassobacter tenebrarum]